MPQLRHDARFATVSDRITNREVLVAVLDVVFATKDAAEWFDLFDRHGMWWQPVQNIEDVCHDPQVTSLDRLATESSGGLNI